MKKTLFILRHTEKHTRGPLKNTATKAGLKLAAKFLPLFTRGFRITDFFGSVEARTWQTIMAAATKKGWKGVEHPAIAEIGGNATYVQWGKWGARFDLKDMTYLEMVRQTVGEARFAKIVAYHSQAIRKIFTRMKGDVALAVGHGVIIEAMLYAHGYPVFEEQIDLRELEGAEIVMHDDGRIEVMRIIRRQ